MDSWIASRPPIPVDRRPAVDSVWLEMGLAWGRSADRRKPAHSVKWQISSKSATSFHPIMSWKRKFARTISQYAHTAVDTRDGRTIEAASKRTPIRAAAIKPELK